MVVIDWSVLLNDLVLVMNRNNLLSVIGSFILRGEGVKEWIGCLNFLFFFFIMLN